MTSETAAQAWDRWLAGWDIPDHLVEAAPESPWHFPPELFAGIARDALATAEISPARRLAAEALPPGGSVLDVGAGGGAAGLPLAPPAGLVVGLDPSEAMLAEFSALADELGVAHAEVHGGWPEAAPRAPVADVVVCHNVVYNVRDLVPFLAELDAHARRRVVVEMSSDHPMVNMGPLWKAIHGIDRPSRPTAADALAVLEEMGIRAGSEVSERLWFRPAQDRAQTVAFARRRLCVGPERDAEIDALLTDDITSRTRQMVAIWWDKTRASR